MGVPAFFRWLTTSCPQVLQEAHLPSRNSINTPNPEIDNLYLDMNGIIHPCTHPQGQTTVPVPECEDDMWNNLRHYLDLLIRTVGPRKLIYFAIDGVAPRAKMNQQRGRRFRAAQEITSKLNNKKRIAKEMKKKGYKVSENMTKNTHWDHNVITPGTVFMEKVSNVIKNYIADNLANDPRWKKLTILFSDSNEPREGEHKILEYIRLQRLQPNYDPNTR